LLTHQVSPVIEFGTGCSTCRRVFISRVKLLTIFIQHVNSKGTSINVACGRGRCVAPPAHLRVAQESERPKDFPQGEFSYKVRRRAGSKMGRYGGISPSPESLGVARPKTIQRTNFGIASGTSTAGWVWSLGAPGSLLESPGRDAACAPESVQSSLLNISVRDLTRYAFRARLGQDASR